MLSKFCITGMSMFCTQQKQDVTPRGDVLTQGRIFLHNVGLGGPVIGFAIDTCFIDPGLANKCQLSVLFYRLVVTVLRNQRTQGNFDHEFQPSLFLSNDYKILQPLFSSPLFSNLATSAFVETVST